MIDLLMTSRSLQQAKTAAKPKSTNKEAQDKTQYSNCSIISTRVPSNILYYICQETGTSKNGREDAPDAAEDRSATLVGLGMTEHVLSKTKPAQWVVNWIYHSACITGLCTAGQETKKESPWSGLESLRPQRIPPNYKTSPLQEKTEDKNPTKEAIFHCLDF